jgi:MFS family permease
VLAAFQMAADIGGVLGPILAGLMADYLSYGTAFAVTGALCLIAGLTWFAAPETLPRKQDEPHLTADEVSTELR